MSGSLPYDERALILAPQHVAAKASKMLSGGGITCLCTTDNQRLGVWLSEGAALVLVDEQVLSTDQRSPLQQFVDAQPNWSDLPILMMMKTGSGSAPAQSLGNLSCLYHPFDEAQLLSLAEQAMRTRKRQYLAREALRELTDRLETYEARDDNTLEHRRKMDAIGQLAGGFAHDFNNLLTSIGGSFELIERRLQKGRLEDLDKVVRMGRESVARGAKLTHKLLAFSSRQSLQKQTLELNTLLDPQRLRAIVPECVQLVLNVPEDLWALQADAQQLQESLDSLLCNACEAMPNGGKLTVQACNEHIDALCFPQSGLSTGDYVRLSVIDTGQGMSQITLDHAFEPFFSTKPVGQGIGLGLSMVYGFSRQSHGYVTLRSRVGHGAQIDLYLPRSLAAPAPATLRRRPGSTEGPILIVEDDRDVRALLYQSLTEDGLSCLTAHDATQALQMLGSGTQVSLLLSDVGLPGMSGRQLAEIARTLRPGLPILLITGYAETAISRDDFLDPGMHLMCKPFELQQLRDQILKLLADH